ncbi:MAG: Ig-like domain-containing protein, partial [Candidatus Micrarchaeia archaeon]
MHNLKLQSSIEFLSTYGWAIIIIIIVLGFVVYLLSAQTSSIPSICSFSSGFSCSEFLLETNSISSTYFFFLSNNQQYPIKGTTVTANVGNLGQVTAPCLPSFVLPGGDLICSGSTSSIVNTGETLTGFANINTSDCTSISNPIACTQKYNVNYTAKLITVTTNYAQNTCSIMIKYPTIYLGEKYPISAEVLLNGNPLTGATVNFTANSPLVTLEPQYTNSQSNGTAITYFESQSSGPYNIKASFYTCSAQTSIPVSTPQQISKLYYVPITLSNQQSTGTSANFQQMIYFNP